MAVTHSNALKEAIGNLVADAHDVGSTDAGGDVHLRDSTTSIAILTLSATAFGAANGTTGVVTAASMPKTTTAVAGGDVDNFQTRDKDNTVLLSGTVTATGMGGDMEMDNPTVVNGQTVNLTSMTYTPPS